RRLRLERDASWTLMLEPGERHRLSAPTHTRDVAHCLSVVRRPEGDRHRLPHRGVQCLGVGDAARTRAVRTCLAELEHGRCVAGARFALERVDLPVRMETTRNRPRLTANLERPHDLLGSEVGRYSHGEHAPVSSWLEVRRLSLVRVARTEVVVWTDR